MFGSLTALKLSTLIPNRPKREFPISFRIPAQKVNDSTTVRDAIAIQDIYKAGKHLLSYNTFTVKHTKMNYPCLKRLTGKIEYESR